MSIDQHIEELRAEARHCHPDERRWIETELANALAEREKIWAEMERLAREKPPHKGGLSLPSARVRSRPTDRGHADRGYPRLCPSPTFTSPGSLSSFRTRASR